MKISEQAATLNEKILGRIESIGGGYVWDAEVFAVTLIDIAVTDDDVVDLPSLCGVQQIAMNASNLSFSAVLAAARTTGLKSLVLSHASLSSQQLRELQACVPEVVLVSNEA